MKISNATYEAHPWRLSEIAADFELEDAWELPVSGGPGDFPAFVEQMTHLNPGTSGSAAARSLWRLRDLLGKWFGIGRISRAATAAVPADSLLPRVPADLRDSARELAPANLPFTPLFRTADEFAAEISNATVHGILHLVWVERRAGVWGGRLGVYVKPRGLFGRVYMAAIKPFRLWIVYPALIAEAGRAWRARSSGGFAPSATPMV